MVCAHWLTHGRSGWTVSSLERALRDYITIRRSLGFRLRLPASSLKNFVAFLQADLAASVPTVADWRLSTVPKYLTPEEVQRVLKACNRRTPAGRRDYAILLLLARLGLRAGEVVALQVDDIDWRAGEIIIRGKGLFHDRMPLPPDVGEALSSYLGRGRPACKTRRAYSCACHA